ncbi:MAG: hypothetical protein PHU21_06670 [Elusimicrobia bacterium]|nr:hypothetical protein [Elusimicrobiota bacterium]
MSFPVNCHRVCLWLSRGEAEEASWPSRWLAQAHLAWCPHCRRYRAQLGLIGDAARLSLARPAAAERVERLQARVLRRLLDGGRGPD